MRRLVIVLALISSAHSLLGQIETTQYFMHTLPQVVDSNPAFMPKFKYTIGLPFSRISATYTNSGFALSDAMKEENGKTVVDIPTWQAALADKTYISNSSQVDLLRIGVKVGDNGYAWLLSSARAVTQIMLPKDIGVLLTSGTGPYVGKTASLAPEAHGMTFWETGVGLSLGVGEKLRFGGKIKRIYGAQSVQTEKAQLLLTVEDDYAMTLSADMLVKTSGSSILDNDVFSDYLNNSGWGGDLGFTFKVLPKLTIAASVVDLGYINWRHNLIDYKLDKTSATFTFSGLNVQDVLNGNTDSFDEQLDSLAENFKPEQVPGKTYKQTLPGKLYLSGTFDLNKTFTIGGLFFAEKFNERTSAGWATSLNMNVGRWMTTSLSYTVSNNSFNNLGAGLALKLGPVQIYAVGDNILGIPISLAKTGFVNSYLNDMQVFNARFGINFVWGWKKQGAAPPEEEEEK